MGLAWAREVRADASSPLRLETYFANQAYGESFLKQDRVCLAGSGGAREVPWGATKSFSTFSARKSSREASVRFGLGGGLTREESGDGGGEGAVLRKWLF